MKLLEKHNMIKIDEMLSERHDESIDLTRILEQQNKATMISTDASIVVLVPKSKTLRIPNEQLTYLTKQLFGKVQRTNVRKYYPNVATSTRAYMPRNFGDDVLQTINIL